MLIYNTYYNPWEILFEENIWRIIFMIENRYWEMAYKNGKGVTVSNVVRGLRYTVAETDNARAGLAFSFPWDVSSSETAFKVLSRLPCDCNRVMELKDSPCLGDRAVAVSVANALIGSDGVLSDQIPEIARGSRILLVGYIHPMAMILRKRGLDFAVLDNRYPGSIPMGTGLRYASLSDLVILSASSVVNGTWEDLISLSKDLWLVGPSAPMNSSLFAGSKVSVVMGRKISRIKGLSLCVSRGGGTRDLAPYTSKVLLRI